MEKSGTDPWGFNIDYYQHWSGLKYGPYGSFFSSSKFNDVTSSDLSQSQDIIEKFEFEESEKLFRDFKDKMTEAERNFKAVADKSKSKIKNVFERLNNSEIYFDLSNEISELSSLLEQTTRLQKSFHGSKRGELLENMVRYMTGKINNLVSESSAMTEKFRQSFSRASSLPPSNSYEKEKVSGQLRLILENTSEDDQTLERKELLHLTRSITQVKAILLRVSEMAIEQGATIDRIDFNLTQTVQQVSQGNRQLERAIEHSESRCAKIVIKAQVVLMILLFGLLLFKYAK